MNHSTLHQPAGPSADSDMTKDTIKAVIGHSPHFADSLSASWVVPDVSRKGSFRVRRG
ncbi:MAG: hypothetical protein JWR81_4910 [Pseudonocardia sp.]|jgi:hypothetical protein|nr:hypothetical protein [Pseudonocardia sp.]MDT7618796.1 hypothetical protein [Pseudonocardiales bacterium]